MTDEEVAKWIESESWIDANWDVRAGYLVHIPTNRSYELKESIFTLDHSEYIASIEGADFWISNVVYHRLRSLRNRLLITTKAAVR